VTLRAAALGVLAVTLALSLLSSCSRDDGGPPNASDDKGSSASTAPVPEEPREVVVAPAGDDRGTGTVDDPWRTLGAALARLRPGDTLLVRAGTYRERIRKVELRPGRADARITVRAWPEERPVLEGLLWLDRPSYWTIEGLRVEWDDERAGRKDHMVKVTDGVGWRFSANELAGARSFAALLVASDRGGEPASWTVAGNCIHSTRKANGANQDHLLYVNTGLEAGPGIVERNVLFDAPNGSGVKLGGSSEDEGGAADVVVRNNTIWGASQSILVSWRSARNTISGNLLGRTGPRYAAIRGYRLSGSGNVATGNFAFQTTGVLHNDEGYGRVADGGGNRGGADPAFDRTDACDGFHPADPVAAGAGHLAVGP
jgi:hypothetical protein